MEPETRNSKDERHYKFYLLNFTKNFNNFATALAAYHCNAVWGTTNPIHQIPSHSDQFRSGSNINIMTGTCSVDTNIPWIITGIIGFLYLMGCIRTAHRTEKERKNESENREKQKSVKSQSRKHQLAVHIDSATKKEEEQENGNGVEEEEKDQSLKPYIAGAVPSGRFMALRLSISRTP